MMGKIETGQTVSVHYVGTFEGGEEFDNSRTRGNPITCEVGAGQLIKGFDSALVGMAVGEIKSISLQPADAYGEIMKEAIQDVPRNSFPAGFQLIKDGVVEGQNEIGDSLRATIISYDNESVKLDFNHPMAGKNLNFEIEVMDIKSQEG